MELAIPEELPHSELQLVAKWLEHARENALSAPKNAKTSQNKQRGLIVAPPPPPLPFSKLFSLRIKCNPAIHTTLKRGRGVFDV